MLFKKDEICSSNQEELVKFLIETREKQLLITTFYIKEIEKQMEILEKRKSLLLHEKMRFKKIIFWLKECRFLYYLRSGK